MEEIKCRCGWGGDRWELIYEKDIEQVHPKNRNNPHCNLQDKSGCHWTEFFKCPKCKKCLFADGMFIG